MVDIYVSYEGDLHCRAEHGPSSVVLETDAPLDNHGRGAAFSPTDLLATALGTCMATVMGILARARQFPVEGTTIHVKKSMSASGPRRVAGLSVAIVMPPAARSIDAEGRAALEHTALNCPVRLSVHPAIDVPVRFDWGDGL